MEIRKIISQQSKTERMAMLDKIRQTIRGRNIKGGNFTANIAEDFLLPVGKPWTHNRYSKYLANLHTHLYMTGYTFPTPHFIGTEPEFIGMFEPGINIDLALEFIIEAKQIQRDDEKDSPTIEEEAMETVDEIPDDAKEIKGSI